MLARILFAAAMTVICVALAVCVLKADEVRVLVLDENNVLANYYRIASQTGLIDGAPLVNCALIGSLLDEVVLAASPAFRQPDDTMRRFLCICDGVEWHAYPPIEQEVCFEAPLIP